MAFFNYNNNITYFLPQKLEKNSILPAFISRVKKREIDLEFQSFPLNHSILSQHLLNLKENQFYIYNSKPFSETYYYSFFFQYINFFNKDLEFSCRGSSPRNRISFLHLYKLWKALRLDLNSLRFFKSRPLSFQTKGCRLQFFACPVHLKENLTFSTKIDERTVLLASLPYIGFLNSYGLEKLNLTVNPLYKTGSYNIKNQRFKTYFRFEKSSKILKNGRK